MRQAIAVALKAGACGSTELLERVQAAGTKVTTNALFCALRVMLEEREIEAEKNGFRKVYSLRRRK